MSPLTTGGKSVALQQSEPRRFTNLPHNGSNPIGDQRRAAFEPEPSSMRDCGRCRSPMRQ